MRTCAWVTMATTTTKNRVFSASTMATRGIEEPPRRAIAEADKPRVFEDLSTKHQMKGRKEDVPKRIRRSVIVIIICGNCTDTTVRVTAELKIPSNEGSPIWLLQDRKDATANCPRESLELEHNTRVVKASEALHS